MPRPPPPHTPQASSEVENPTTTMKRQCDTLLALFACLAILNVLRHVVVMQLSVASAVMMATEDAAAEKKLGSGGGAERKDEGGRRV